MIKRRELSCDSLTLTISVCQFTC